MANHTPRQTKSLEEIFPSIRYYLTDLLGVAPDVWLTEAEWIELIEQIKVELQNARQQ